MRLTETRHEVTVPPDDLSIEVPIAGRHLSVFGEWLRRKRAEKGLTLEALAERSGLNISTLNKWELGDITSPQPAKIQKLAVALELKPETVFQVIADSERFLERARERRAKQEEGTNQQHRSDVKSSKR